ncbi:pyridoxamine 5'-phosphate oxidase family protein [Maribacter sp. CXY002]|uniref:pyridoxamine 5'-phosphate oxidase family protein n=1 Tax=Maribacter luteocoastalis TaxID=3407671 RepID=UPI003B67D124
MINLKKNECIDILRNNYLGHLAFISNKKPYVLPITFFFDEANNSIISYAIEGHKINAMRKNKAVSLEVEEIDTVNNWRSILLHGTFEELHQIDAKHKLHLFTQGVKKMVTEKEHMHPEFISDFSVQLNTKGMPVVYRINIISMTGKQRKPKKE